MHWRRNTFPKLDKQDYWWARTNWIEPEETWEEWPAHLALHNGVSLDDERWRRQKEGCWWQARHSKLYFWWKDTEAKGVNAPVLQTIAVLVILIVRFAPVLVPGTIFSRLSSGRAQYSSTVHLLLSAPTNPVTMYWVLQYYCMETLLLPVVVEYRVTSLCKCSYQQYYQ